MITSSVYHVFYTTVEGFLCTEFDCAVKSALLAEFQACLPFFVLFCSTYSIIYFFLSQYARGIRAWAAAYLVEHPCLPGWERGWLFCYRAARRAPSLGFPCEPFSPSFAIQMQSFLLIYPLPYLPARSWPSHPCSTLPCTGGEEWGSPSQASEEGALKQALRVWQLRASGQVNKQAQRLLLLGIPRCRGCVPPSCQWLAPLQQPGPGSCGTTRRVA